MSNAARRGHVFKDEKTGTFGYIIDVAQRGQPRKQQRKRGFETHEEATDALITVARDVKDGNHVTSKETTLTEYVATYLDTQVALGLLRQSTAAGYRDLYDRHIGPEIGAKRLQDVDATHLDRLYSKLLTEGRRVGTKTRGEGLSVATVRQCHAILSGVFKHAVKKRVVAANPAKRADPPRPKTPETPTWTVEQLRVFLEHPAVGTDPLAPLWKVAAHSGLRRGELLGLGWADVDLDSGWLTVRRNVVTVAGKVTIGEPKTKRSYRRVKIGDETIAVLRAHEAAQREHRLVMGSGWHDLGLVFPGVDGQPRRPTGVSQLWAALVRRTGLPRIPLHGVRHCHETMLHEQGLRVHTIAARMGHDPTVSLQVYAHAHDDAQDAAAAMESLLTGKRPTLRVVEPDPDSRDRDGDHETPGAHAEGM